MRTSLKIICSTIAIATIAMTSPAAAASFTSYSNSTDFFNAISSSNYTETFSAITNGGFANTNFSSNGFTINASSVSGLYGETLAGSSPSIRLLSSGGAASTELLFTFTTNVFAVGGYFLSAEAVAKPGSFTATVVAAGNITNVFTNNTTTFDNSYLGWIFDTNIISLTLSTDPENAGFASAAEMTVAVPEPSTYALLGLAAAGLAGYLLRRRRA
ncbi:MAG: PEP-CTERM sorting domain-containing protein [Chthoniobacterales bacterium]